ncbi:NAD(+) diphosphatase [Phenylobacterium immobile]|uniref:NAD(+) diphosphatase n=1 Tax=Phenylobacterium immobile TaxID=21 RepID=UPI000B04B108|nr:NAD(+) diphosphatase [Phenylobacterium immobile]
MVLSAFRNTFAGSPLDRASDRRGDAAWLATKLVEPAAQVMAVWSGKFLVEGDAIAWIDGAMAQAIAGGPEALLFLGLRDAAAVFALELDGSDDPTAGPLAGLGVFEELRPLAARLSPEDAAMAAATRAMFEWRRRHRFCAACGHASRQADGGWKRVCEACATQHFPRTDPVVIMLACHGERVMLGRQESWPAGQFSALAGFMEPGESIEEACARELFEEAGLRAVSVRYHSSQPWPFPANLMIGLIAEVEDDEGTPDQTELSEVRWFTRAEARDLLEGRIEGLRTPNRIAIAAQLLHAWAYEDAAHENGADEA